MFDYLIMLVVAVAGLTDGHWALIVVGAFGLSIDGFISKLRMLRHHPSVPIDWSIVRVFVMSQGYALVACAASYVLGKTVGMLEVIVS